MDESLKERIALAAQVLIRAGADEVYLFGSAARGAAHEGSDLDLAVSGLPPRVFFRAYGEARDLLGRPMDLVDLDEDTPFTRYLLREKELVRIG